MKYNFKKAFTLAEILITLTILGVVAATTIPALMNNMQEQQYNVGVQKAYSTLSQGLTKLLAQNSGIVQIGYSGSSGYVLRDDFCSVLNCTRIDTFGNIIAAAGGSSPFYYKAYKGSPITSKDFSNGGSEGGYAGAVLNNGYYLWFQTLDSCNNDGINTCGSIEIDINGIKGPNMWGQDIYLFRIVFNNGSYSMVPAGGPNDTTAGPSEGSWGGCIPNHDQSGAGCTYQRILSPNNMP